MDKKNDTIPEKILAFLNSWYFVFLPPMLVTALSIIIGHFSLPIILISLGIIFLMILFSFGAVFFYIEKFDAHLEADEISDEIYNEMSLMLNQYWDGEIPGVPGIIKDEDLAKYEAKIDCSEIWLVSYDLESEFNDGLYQDVVINNLKRGIKYKYFVAQTPGIEVTIDNEVINTLPDECKQNFEYFILKNEFFFLVDNIDFVIYDPYNAASSGISGCKAYMSMVLSNGDVIYEAPMNSDLRDRIVARLIEYLEVSGTNEE